MEDIARAIFEATPHRHPAGHVPDWDAQPEQVKLVFRGFADRDAITERVLCVVNADGRETIDVQALNAALEGRTRTHDHHLHAFFSKVGRETRIGFALVHRLDPVAFAASEATAADMRAFLDQVEAHNAAAFEPLIALAKAGTPRRAAQDDG